jgi:hypothetical protein
MRDMEGKSQKYRVAFQEAGWELIEDYDPMAPNKVTGRYKVPGIGRRELQISYDPDGPYDHRGEIAIHDVFQGAFTVTNRVLTPQEAVEAFRYE